MSDKKTQSIGLIQTFLDQAIGCGLFKSAADVLATQGAIDYLKGLGVGKLYASEGERLADLKSGNIQEAG
jgi:hypothetical protein